MVNKLLKNLLLAGITAMMIINIAATAIIPYDQPNKNFILIL